MKKWYEIREVNVQYGFRTLYPCELRREYGVFVMPHNINTFICKTKEEAEDYIARHT
jgi:hypothetical protein